MKPAIVKQMIKNMFLLNREQLWHNDSAFIFPASTRVSIEFNSCIFQRKQ